MDVYPNHLEVSSPHCVSMYVVSVDISHLTLPVLGLMTQQSGSSWLIFCLMKYEVNMI